MICFNHPDLQAVGLCKWCNRGLCAACATDLGHGLACKGQHEDAVKVVHDLVTRNARISAAAPASRFIAPLFYLFAGLVFAAFGYSRGGGMTNLPFLLGVGFVVFAIVAYLFNRNMFGTGRTRAPPTDGPARGGTTS